MLANCVFRRPHPSRGLVWDGLIFTGCCLCFANNIFSDNSGLTFFSRSSSYEKLHPPCVLSWMQVCASRARAGLRGELRRPFSRAFWGVFRKKDFSAVAVTPCWTLLPREDGEVRRLGGGDFLALLERQSAGSVESFDVEGGAVALQDIKTSCRWATTTWPQPGLQLSTESYRRDQRHWGCCRERRGQLVGGVGRRTRQQAISN